MKVVNNAIMVNDQEISKIIMVNTFDHTITTSVVAPLVNLRKGIKYLLYRTY